MKKSNGEVRKWLEVLPFILPAILLLGLFVVYPLIKNIYMSITDYSIMPNAENSFIGMKNYIDILSEAKTFSALRNSFLMVLITVPLQMILGLLLAYFINSVKFLSGFFKTAYYIPVITSWLVVAYVFKYLFAAGKDGLINYVLLSTGIISEPVSWLQNTWLALAVVWIVSIWKTAGWCMIIYFTGLQGIDKGIYESATIDGAGKLQMLWYISVPMLKPVTFYILVNSIIGSFNSFIQTFVITNGDPVDTTHVMMSLMYTEAFDNFEFGKAAAIGVIQGVLILIIVLMTNVVFGKKEEAGR